MLTIRSISGIVRALRLIEHLSKNINLIKGVSPLTLVEKMEVMKNKSFLGELWDFLKVRKVWWLTPIILMLVLVGVLIVMSQTTVISSIVYPLL